MTLQLDLLFTDTPSFETDRLTLRPLNEADLGALWQVNSDPEVTRYLPYPYWQTQEDADAWIKRYIDRFAARVGVQWTIHRKSDRAILGNALIFGFSVDHDVAEIGYVIGRAHWGQGYVAEAMQPLVAHAFTVLGCHRLQAKLSVDNRASARVLEKLGFAHEGTSREDFLKDGARFDTAFYGLLQREWQATSSA